MVCQTSCRIPSFCANSSICLSTTSQNGIAVEVGMVKISLPLRELGSIAGPGGVKRVSPVLPASNASSSALAAGVSWA